MTIPKNDKAPFTAAFTNTQVHSACAVQMDVNVRTWFIPFLQNVSIILTCELAVVYSWLFHISLSLWQTCGSVECANVCVCEYMCLGMCVCSCLSATHLETAHRSDGAYGVPWSPATGNVATSKARGATWTNVIFLSFLLNFRSACGCVTVTLWLCHCVIVSLCGCVTVTLCGCVTVTMCGCVTVWLCH